jgi:hypothetical protein
MGKWVADPEGGNEESRKAGNQNLLSCFLAFLIQPVFMSLSEPSGGIPHLCPSVKSVVPFFKKSALIRK